MKPRKITLISLALLATLLIGAGVVIVLSQAEVKANVKWDPKSATDKTFPATWYAEIWLTGGHKRDEIDTATILLEGSISPSGTPYAALHGPRLIVPFDGNVVLNELLGKLPHTAPGKYRIGLEITGLLLDGTPFRGTGTISLTIENPSPP